MPEEIYLRVLPWVGSITGALAWYQTVIPSFGKTPLELVREGHTDAVVQYLDRIADGGYA